MSIHAATVYFARCEEPGCGRQSPFRKDAEAAAKWAKYHGKRKHGRAPKPAKAAFVGPHPIGSSH